jgi:hypothetical protein
VEVPLIVNVIHTLLFFLSSIACFFLAAGQPRKVAGGFDVGRLKKVGTNETSDPGWRLDCFPDILVGPSPRPTPHSFLVPSILSILGFFSPFIIAYCHYF